ncbi:15641_t:CDS:2, partial [Racocetra persica]
GSEDSKKDIIKEVNEVEAAIRVGNKDIEGIKKEKFAVSILVGVTKYRIQPSAYKVANLSQEKIIVTAYVNIYKEIQKIITMFLREK